MKKSRIETEKKSSLKNSSNLKESQDELSLKSGEFERFAIDCPINFMSATGNNSRIFEGPN